MRGQWGGKIKGLRRRLLKKGYPQSHIEEIVACVLAKSEVSALRVPRVVTKRIGELIAQEGSVVVSKGKVWRVWSVKGHDSVRNGMAKVRRGYHVKNPLPALDL